MRCWFIYMWKCSLLVYWNCPHRIKLNFHIWENIFFFYEWISKFFIRFSKFHRNCSTPKKRQKYSVTQKMQNHCSSQAITSSLAVAMWFLAYTEHSWKIDADQWHKLKKCLSHFSSRSNILIAKKTFTYLFPLNLEQSQTIHISNWSRIRS